MLISPFFKLIAQSGHAPLQPEMAHPPFSNTFSPERNLLAPELARTSI